jgi:rhamnosyltransferase
MSEPLVSIILRSFNEGWALRETLPALRAQAYRNWELIVFDSGSTDGSVDLISKAEPRVFVQLTPAEYIPGCVMNHGMRLARADYCVFLNADATPQGQGWLRPLVTVLLETQTAAVFGRQIPRSDCQAVYACDYERCFGLDRESARWDHFFSMANSGVRKDVWQQRGFLESIQYAEDDEYTRWCRARGYRVAYCPDSVVMHSHNYTASQAYRRSFGDAKALAVSWKGRRSDFNWLKTVLLGVLSDCRHDFRYCSRHRRWAELGHAARIRWSQRRGRLHGFHAGWATYRHPEP